MGYCGPQGHPYNCSMGLRISLSLYIYDVMHYMMTSFNYILHGLVTHATAPHFLFASDAYDIVFVTIVYTTQYIDQEQNKEITTCKQYLTVKEISIDL